MCLFLQSIIKLFSENIDNLRWKPRWQFCLAVAPTQLCQLAQIIAETLMRKWGLLRTSSQLRRVSVMIQMSTGCLLGLQSVLQLTDFSVVLLMCCLGVQLRCGQNVKQLYPADISVYAQFNWTVGGNLIEHNMIIKAAYDYHKGSISHHGNNKQGLWVDGSLTPLSQLPFSISCGIVSIYIFIV